MGINRLKLFRECSNFGPLKKIINLITISTLSQHFCPHFLNAWFSMNSIHSCIFDHLFGLFPPVIKRVLRKESIYCGFCWICHCDQVSAIFPSGYPHFVMQSLNPRLIEWSLDVLHFTPGLALFQHNELNRKQWDTSPMTSSVFVSQEGRKIFCHQNCHLAWHK